MWNEIGSRLLAALGAAAEGKLGPMHALAEACRARDIARARDALTALPPAEADALLAEAHLRMREGAALAAWRPADARSH
jgi:hypothetical protein